LSARQRLAASGSDPGRERDNNEDRVLCDPERGIYAVVDGVGGESGGEIAAQTAVEILHARLSRRTTDAERLIREAIALANKKIYELAQADPALIGMACVLTVAVVDGGQVTVGHVGDSRLYLLRPGEIRKVTRDHSPIGMREDAGELGEAEAMRHPRRNEIFRDVGSAPHEPDEEGFIDVTRLSLPADGALLLCSDGLSDLLPAQQIRELSEAQAAHPQAAVRELIAAANAAGGKDNVSVVLVQGERYAAAVRARKPGAAAGATAATSRQAPRGRGVGAAAAAERSPRAPQPSRTGTRALPAPLRLLASRPAFLLYGAVLAALGLSAFTNPFGRLTGNPGPAAAGKVLRVGVGDGGYATIGEALARARAGDTVEVGPGEYREAIALKEGVALISGTPRAALLLPPLGNSGPVVSADGVGDASLEGFRIAGDGKAPLVVGIHLAASAVSVERVEIAGASRAGIEIAGDDRSEIRYCFLHDNPGAGIEVGGGSPGIYHGLLARNGRGAVAPRAGIEVREGAQPAVIDNRFEGNGGGGILLPTADRADELFGWNFFTGAARAEAIRAPGVAPAPAAPARPRGAGRHL
jgi:serine/threonine protein phosphatase PrpC